MADISTGNIPAALARTLGALQATKDAVRAAAAAHYTPPPATGTGSTPPAAGRGPGASS